MISVPKNTSIRDMYQHHGVERYYKNCAPDYYNPHSHIIERHLQKYIKGRHIDITDTLDLCCGDGLVTKVVEKHGGVAQGLDPFMHEVYTSKTGNHCYTDDFKSIASNGLPRRFKTIICSFALHLCESSMLNAVLFQLASNCDHLLLISPNKKPTVTNYFTLNDGINYLKVQSRLYQSLVNIC